jgi:hypothetical protein
MAALLIPALFFGLIHMTNAVNGDIPQALVQTGYSIVVGLVFGAIYIRSGDIISVMIAHAAIDITNRMFVASSHTPVPVIIAFLVMLATSAMAQVEAGQVYRIVSAKYGTVMSESPILHTLSCASAGSATDYHEMWKFNAADDGKFTIQNVYTQRYM